MCEQVQVMNQLSKLLGDFMRSHKAALYRDNGNKHSDKNDAYVMNDYTMNVQHKTKLEGLTPADQLRQDTMRQQDHNGQMTTADIKLEDLKTLWTPPVWNQRRTLAVYVSTNSKEETHATG